MNSRTFSFICLFCRQNEKSFRFWLSAGWMNETFKRKNKWMNKQIEEEWLKPPRNKMKLKSKIEKKGRETAREGRVGASRSLNQHQEPSWWCMPLLVRGRDWWPVSGLDRPFCQPSRARRKFQIVCSVVCSFVVSDEKPRSFLPRNFGQQLRKRQGNDAIGGDAACGDFHLCSPVRVRSFFEMSRVVVAGSQPSPSPSPAFACLKKTEAKQNKRKALASTCSCDFDWERRPRLPHRRPAISFWPTALVIISSFYGRTLLISGPFLHFSLRLFSPIIFFIKLVTFLMQTMIHFGRMKWTKVSVWDSNQIAEI